MYSWNEAQLPHLDQSSSFILPFFFSLPYSRLAESVEKLLQLRMRFRDKKEASSLRWSLLGGQAGLGHHPETNCGESWKRRTSFSFAVCYLFSRQSWGNNNNTWIKGWKRPTPHCLLQPPWLLMHPPLELEWWEQRIRSFTHFHAWCTNTSEKKTKWRD